MKRRIQKNLIILCLILGAVVTGGILIIMRWPTSCIRYEDTETTAPTNQPEAPAKTPEITITEEIPLMETAINK